MNTFYIYFYKNIFNKWLIYYFQMYFWIFPQNCSLHFSLKFEHSLKDETLIGFISEQSFWRCVLLKNAAALIESLLSELLFMRCHYRTTFLDICISLFSHNGQDIYIQFSFCYITMLITFISNINNYLKLKKLNSDFIITFSVSFLRFFVIKKKLFNIFMLS